MKITAEFNSNEELLSFIDTFGSKRIPINTSFVMEKVGPKEAFEQAEETAKVDTPTVTEDEVKASEEKVTFEMVRAIFQKLLDNKRHKEAKEITLKYGASKLKELKEEYYADVIREAEELLNG